MENLENEKGIDTITTKCGPRLTPRPCQQSLQRSQPLPSRCFLRYHFYTGARSERLRDFGSCVVRITPRQLCSPILRFVYTVLCPAFIQLKLLK